MSSEKCKLNQPCAAATHLLERPKSGTLTTQNSGEFVDHRNSDLLLVQRQNGPVPLEDGLAVSYKTEHNVTI